MFPSETVVMSVQLLDGFAPSFDLSEYEDGGLITFKSFDCIFFFSSTISQPRLVNGYCVYAEWI